MVAALFVKTGEFFTTIKLIKETKMLNIKILKTFTEGDIHYGGGGIYTFNESEADKINR